MSISKWKASRVTGFIVGLPLIWGLAPQANGAADEVTELRPYVITGSVASYREEDAIIPLISFRGKDLAEQQGASLGALLEGQPGVHASAFAQGASRPIIRGFDGPRVRILDQGMGVLDVSEDSPDHAVAHAGLFGGYVDVTRGPATVAYGGSAIGGVVNLIPEPFPEAGSPSGLTGWARTDWDGASQGWASRGIATLNGGNWGLRVNGSWQEHGDYAIPGYGESAYGRSLHQDEDAHYDDDSKNESPHEGEDSDHGGWKRLDNSFVDRRSGAVTFRTTLADRWEWTFGYQNVNDRYGVPGHLHGEDHDHEDHHDDLEDPYDNDQDDHGEQDEGDHDHHDDHQEGSHVHDPVHVKMRKHRGDVRLRLILDNPWLSEVQAGFQMIDYRHDEREGETTATRFDRQGWEGRMELRHHLADSIVGNWGLQAGSILNGAMGEEAHTPDSKQKELAIFLIEEWRAQPWAASLGLRMERRTLNTEVHDRYADWAKSLSMGLRRDLGDRVSASFSIAHAERHPTATELYANGAHAATRQYEVGDPGLKKEGSNGADLHLKIRGEGWNVHLTTFWTRFDGMIYAQPEDEWEHGFRVFSFRAVDANLHGYEIELEKSFDLDGILPETRLKLFAMADHVIARLRGEDGRLPRIPGSRIGGGVELSHKNWKLRSELRHAFRQEAVAVGETPGEAFTQWNARLSSLVINGRYPVSLYLKLENLLNEEIRPHTSFLKDFAPLPGRSCGAGIQVGF